MKRIHVVVATAIIALIPQGVGAVPVVPNFTQGSMTSRTETTSQVTETINSINYNTGYQYVITGTNISHDGDTLSAPSVTAGSNTIEGVTSTWTGMDLQNKPNFTITTPGEAFQFTQHYQGPGITNQTVIQRVTEVKSVTDTTSVFTQ